MNQLTLPEQTVIAVFHRGLRHECSAVGLTPLGDMSLSDARLSPDTHCVQRPRPFRLFALQCMIILSSLASVNLVSPSAVAEELSFERDIRPILRAHCLDCHGAEEELQGGLDLRQVRLMQKGGESGPAISGENPDDSLLLRRIRSGEMPPGESKVSDGELEKMTAWIRAGSHTARPEPDSIPPGLGITPEEREFWSFRPIQRPEEPALTEDRELLARNSVDRFLLDRMPAGVRFSGEADRHTLILRTCFVLTGLPPESAEMQRWMNETSEDWHAQLVESLLRSPHYGERWGRHWLDIAGYADSDGYTVRDTERAWAWKYRDYVIRSFNAGKPFDRFITEQLAGDELAGPRQGDWTAAQTELLTATGFLRMAADGTGSGEDNPTARNQVIGDTLKIVTTSLLGLSVGCAQCHDHRYDPIPQTDYYALRAVFAPALDWNQWQVPAQRLISLYTEADRAKAASVAAEAASIGAERAARQAEYMTQALEKEVLKFAEPLRSELREAYQTASDKRTPRQSEILAGNPSVNISPGVLYQYLPEAAEDLKKYDARIAEVTSKRPPEEFLAVLTEPAGHLPETKLFHRGDFLQTRHTVPPGALTAACPEDAVVQFPVDDPELTTSGRRLAFAKWLTSRDNPLVARVLVNRFWLHHFGRGLVPTPADFGRLGIPPTHPELLDWLADEFISNGWSVAHLHHLLLNSAAWRQTSQASEQLEEADPDNQYYSRQFITRLDAEVLRDRMLAVSGRLSPELYGPPIPIQEDDAGQVIIGDQENRRSVYVRVRRSQPVGMLQAFDAPVMETNCEKRPVSTVATQSLLMMNSDSVLSLSMAFSRRCREEAKPMDPAVLPEFSNLPERLEPRWIYGFGRLDEETLQVSDFRQFEHFTGSRWQVSPELPDREHGYVLLSSDGGHPDMRGREVIRKFQVSENGSLKVTGNLSHGSPNGDGVRGRIIYSGQQESPRVLGDWISQNGNTETLSPEVNVRSGDQIQFVVDCRSNHNSDSFQWPVTLTMVTGDGTRIHKSQEEFRGPEVSVEQLAGQIQRAWNLAYLRDADETELADAMEFLFNQMGYFRENRSKLPEGRTEDQQALVNLCQILMMSNEFLYVR